MYAVILTGGKQYRVKAGDLLAVEKLGVDQGHKVHFDRVLLIEDGESVQVGRPVLENAVVEAEVVENFKDEKVLIFKKKRRKQFRRTRGHRQQLTKVRIDRILPDKSVLPAIHPVEDGPGASAKAVKPKKVTPAKTGPKPKAPKPAAAKTKKAIKE
ncbi:MAG: 50S ribosomal protein L21 [Candidatus Aminicenantes bacterium]